MEETKIKLIRWDEVLLAVLAVVLLVYYCNVLPHEFMRSALLVVSLGATIPVLVSAGKALRNHKVSVDLLASLALIAALITREWASAVFINLMLTSARIFGEYTENKARAALQSLLKLRPLTAKVKRGVSVVTIPVEQLAVGDNVLIELGERVPIDGVVVEGSGSIDQSSLTGESVPVAKTVGDNVYSATLAVAGSLIIQAKKIGKDTMLEKIINLVENSHQEKASIRTSGERFATWYIVITLVVALVVFLVFRDFKLLLSLLLVACADDIAVAVPLAFMAAIGYAAKRGVVIKGASYLEGLTKVKTIITDKTGTLTTGKLTVQRIVPFPFHTESEVLALGATTGSLSDHPIAKTILHYAQEQNIVLATPDDPQEIPGKGITASVDGHTVLSGNLALLNQFKVGLTDMEQKIIEKEKEHGFTITLVAKDNQAYGMILTSDTVKPNMKEVIHELRDLGINNWVMLTGDNETVAQRVGKALEINRIHASLLPADKLKYVQQYLHKKWKVAMIGDGVNDAASLAVSDIGIAMGAIGADTAVEAADIALMRDDMEEIPDMVRLAHYTVRVARQDFWIWGFVNVVGLTLVFARLLGPQGAAAYNFVTDFLPLLNSMRLFNLHRNYKPKAL